MEIKMHMKDETTVFCQSCAMPMVKEEDYGTNVDGRKNADYCVYCYKNGKFTSDTTMEEMIAFCAPLISKGNPYNVSFFILQMLFETVFACVPVVQTNVGKRIHTPIQ